MDLPFPGRPGEFPDRDRLQAAVRDADAVLFATPEYHGSFAATLKLVIENLGFPSVLAGKPAALIGVASGAIGAVKALEHLRSVLSHVGTMVLPGPVSIAGVHKVFDAEGNCLDAAVEGRTRKLARQTCSPTSSGAPARGRGWRSSRGADRRASARRGGTPGSAFFFARPAGSRHVR